MEQELVVASIADREHAKYAAAAICREYTEKGVIPFSVTALMEIIAPHVAERVAEINAMKAQALASSAPLAESPRFVATPAGQNKNPEWMNATVQHENAANQPSQAVATPDLVEQAKIYFQREYDRDRTQSIFVGMAKFAAMHAASLEARVRTLEQELEVQVESQQAMIESNRNNCERADPLSASLRDAVETLHWIEQESIDTTAVNKARKALLTRLSSQSETPAKVEP